MGVGEVGFQKILLAFNKDSEDHVSPTRMGKPEIN